MLSRAPVNSPSSPGIRPTLLADPGRAVSLRLIHVVESYAAGTLTAVHQLVNGLAQRGHDVLLVHGMRSETPANYRELVHPCVRMRHLDWGREVEPIRDAMALFTLVRLFRKERPDIVHLHSSKAGFIGRLAAHLSGPIPAVYSPHGFVFQQPTLNARRRAIYRRLEAVAARLSTSTTVACSTDELALARRFKAPACCIENAVELDALAQLMRQREHTRGSRTSSTLTVVGLGRTDEVKRPQLFEAVAQQLQQAAPGRFRLLWIGDGPYHFQPQGPVAHLGWMRREQALEFLALEADVLLQTSVAEGMPLAVLEAKALGVPAVVPDVPGNRCAVTPGLSGYIISGETPEAFASALLRIADRPALLRQISAQAAEEARSRYATERLLSEFDGLYRRKLAGICGGSSSVGS